MRSANSSSAHQNTKRPRRTFILFYGLFGILLLTNVATGLALYLAPEINTLFRQDNSHILSAYEQRIVQLRLEVDRLHSRQYAQMGDLNLQMHELVQQQDVLSEQHEYVRVLADMAREMGISLGDHSQEDEPSTATTISAAPSGDVAELVSSLMTMQEETRRALVALSDAATLSTQEIENGLRSVGLQPSLPDAAVGGPFIPASGSEISIVDEANAVAQALTAFRSARDAMQAAPIRTPINGAGQVTSSFGNRTDPFLKRLAFHAGIDFRAPTGTPIIAAGEGTVIHAGANGGYGKMVDLDHGNGLVTRYAHMSAVTVSEGQTVSGGQQLGLSGSTGRSTGPHLHFEVRRADSAVDPSRFLSAGRTLARFL